VDSVNPIAKYYRDEIREVNYLYNTGQTTYEHLIAIADEYIAWMKYRKAQAPKGSNIAKMKIPTRAYLIRALA
jgi:hypothetical protein